MLNRISFGAEAPGAPLVIAHGLFGSARNWGVVARRLAGLRPVVTVDMRNHGESAWTGTHEYAGMAADLAEVLAAVADETGRSVDLLGHSMGGKAAMVMALTQPGPLRRLVVADIAPVAYGHSQSHNIGAMRRVDLDTVADRAGAAAAMGLEDAGVAAFLLQSLDLRARRWVLNLDVLERDMAAIVGFPEVTGQFGGAALFLSGALSEYVLPTHRARIRALFPSARFAKIPGAGHWLHAEKPREFEAAVATFLEMDGNDGAAAPARG